MTADRSQRLTGRPINAMCVTPFDDDDRLDDQALAGLVDVLATAGVGIYLGSYGSGEGHLLTTGEIGRLYAGGVNCLRAVPGLGRVLLVAVTGYGQDNDHERSRRAGFDLHLVKPVARARIQAVLAQLAAERER